MSDPGRAEKWVRTSVEQTRAALAARPGGPGDLTVEQYEEQLRGMVAAFLRPTRQYRGVTVDAAQVLAEADGDHLCVHRGTTGHRANMTPRRVHLTLRADGTVATASRDRAPWD